MPFVAEASPDIQHAASYPISSLNKGRVKDKQYFHPSYSPSIPLIPHGVAVALTAPAVFNFTSPSSPARHREAIEVFLGKERAHELTRVKDADLGAKLREEICKFLDGVGVPRGLSQVGYTSGDISKVGRSPSSFQFQIASMHSCGKIIADKTACPRYAPSETCA